MTQAPFQAHFLTLLGLKKPGQVTFGICRADGEPSGESALRKYFRLSGACKKLFANKYDARSYNKIVGPFDLIVDVSLKSFVCCEQHFQDMMAAYVNRLAPHGMIITAGTGLRFGWSGNTPIVYTPGVSIDEAACNWRVLGEEGLEQLSERYHLKVDRCAIQGVAHWHGQNDESGEPQITDETLWLLSKGSIYP